MLRPVRNHWSLENSWQWFREKTLQVDADHYREVNSDQIIAMLRDKAINAKG